MSRWRLAIFKGTFPEDVEKEANDFFENHPEIEVKNISFSAVSGVGGFFLAVLYKEKD